MPVEQGVIEDQVGRFREEFLRVGSMGGQRRIAAEQGANLRQGFRGCHRPLGKRLQMPGNAIHQRIAELLKRLGIHLQRRVPQLLLDLVWH